MIDGAPDRNGEVLLVHAGARLCALPLVHVVETMRPLRTVTLQGTPSFVSGISVVRGSAMPVVDLDAFLGTDPPSASTRYVVVRSEERRFILAVTSVEGVASLDRRGDVGIPLLADACRSSVETLTTRDQQLLAILRVSRIVPEEVWTSLAERGAQA